MNQSKTVLNPDVVIVGAGVAGIYMLHKLKNMGFNVEPNRMKRGDQYVKVTIDIPNNISKELKKMIVDLKNNLNDDVKFKKINN